MAGSRVGEICEVSFKMNSVEYIQIINEVMLPSVNVVFDNPVRIVFMQQVQDQVDFFYFL
jgi:hypothetical protein